MPKYPKLRFVVTEFDGEENGEFHWGRARNKVFDRFYYIQEISDPEESVIEMEALIEHDREFIDAYNSVGFFELDLYNYGYALNMFDQAYRIGNKCIPADFKGRIAWAFVDNRPFLRAMQGLGLTYLLMQKWDRASEVFKKMLAYNQNDNQGIRALAIQSFIAQGKFADVLKICKLYPEDILPDTIYGAVLAHVRLGHVEQTKDAIANAIEFSPNVASELIRKKHKVIESVNQGSVVVGGEDEAYEYWERVGQYWTDPKILKLLENALKKQAS